MKYWRSGSFQLYWRLHINILQLLVQRLIAKNFLWVLHIFRKETRIYLGTTFLFSLIKLRHGLVRKIFRKTKKVSLRFHREENVPKWVYTMIKFGKKIKRISVINCFSGFSACIFIDVWVWGQLINDKIRKIPRSLVGLLHLSSHFTSSVSQRAWRSMLLLSTRSHALSFHSMMVFWSSNLYWTERYLLDLVSVIFLTRWTQSSVPSELSGCPTSQFV